MVGWDEWWDGHISLPSGIPCASVQLAYGFGFLVLVFPNKFYKLLGEFLAPDSTKKLFLPVFLEIVHIVHFYDYK